MRSSRHARRGSLILITPWYAMAAIAAHRTQPQLNAKLSIASSSSFGTGDRCETGSAISQRARSSQALDKEPISEGKVFCISTVKCRNKYIGFPVVNRKLPKVRKNCTCKWGWLCNFIIVWADSSALSQLANIVWTLCWIAKVAWFSRCTSSKLSTFAALVCRGRGPGWLASPTLELQRAHAAKSKRCLRLGGFSPSTTNAAKAEQRRPGYGSATFVQLFPCALLKPTSWRCFFTVQLQSSFSSMRPGMLLQKRVLFRQLVPHRQ